MKPWLGLGLVTSSKNKWKSRRKLLTPAFHFRILNDFLPIINENAEILINKLYQLTDNQSGQSHVIDILDYVTLTTLDVICETAMGIKVNCQTQESEYVTCLHQVSELFLIRICRPWLWPDWAFAISSHGRRYKRCLNVMKTFTMNVIKQRKAEWIEAHKDGCHSKTEHLTDNQDELNEKTHKLENKYETKRMAFLDLLMEHHLKNNVMTIEDVREEVDTFMFAVSFQFSSQEIFNFYFYIYILKILLSVSRVMIQPQCLLVGLCIYLVCTKIFKIKSETKSIRF